MRLSVPTVFLKSWIKSHYGERLLALWRQEDDSIRNVELLRRTALRVVSRRATAVAARAQPTAPAAKEAGRDRFAGSPLDPKLTFASFCEGRSNDVACRAARAVAGAPGGSSPAYNPLYIHAGVGLGKTHLLQAIAHEAQALDPTPARPLSDGRALHDPVRVVAARSARRSTSRSGCARSTCS